MQRQQINDIVKDFGLEKVIERCDISIMGSPERVKDRMVIEAQDQKCFLLEQVFDIKKEHRFSIARIILQLTQQGFKKAIPYCVNTHNQEPFVVYDQKYFQLQPFISGEPLDRPKYVFDDWRGKVMAEVLIDLKKTSEKIDQTSLDNDFSLIMYIDKLFLVIKKRHPLLAEKLQGIHDELKQRLYPVYERLPKSFAHGDFHPNNIIWSQKEALALIDWEFVGIKTELYDAANMISCLGIEDPACLVSPIVVSFIKKLKESQLFSQESFQALMDLVIAIRFAWISEWLRKKDQEMLRLELDYFELLIEYRTKIIATWAID